MHNRLLAALMVGLWTFGLAPSVAETGDEHFESSRVCMECHRDIYRNWKNSLHALAFTNPIFQTAYNKAYRETKGEAKKYCLNCHAPTVRITGDYDAEQPITREGVTCDFCHTVAGIDLEKENPFIQQPGDVKRSVLDGAVSGHHETARSDDFASSRLCAGCHDFKNRHGVHVGVTYSEWRASPHAKKNQHCQNCHMPEIPGKTAVEGGRDRIHDHSLTHNLGTMKNAIRLQTVSIKPKNNALEVVIDITNEKAGHSVPTGTPARHLVLEVRSLDAAGREIESRTIEYHKTIVDGKGNEIQPDGDVFLHGVEIVFDNRLKSGETRRETVYFSRRVSDVKHIEAEAYFLYQPVVTEKVDMKIPLFQDEWDVDGKR